eukprot:4895507-Pleurochrysis_carterae.AAC.1
MEERCTMSDGSGASEEYSVTNTANSSHIASDGRLLHAMLLMACKEAAPQCRTAAARATAATR